MLRLNAKTSGLRLPPRPQPDRFFVSVDGHQQLADVDRQRLSKPVQHVDGGVFRLPLYPTDESAIDAGIGRQPLLTQATLHTQPTQVYREVLPGLHVPN